MNDENFNAPSRQKSPRTIFIAMGVLLALGVSLAGLVYYNKARRQQAPDAMQAPSAAGPQAQGLEQQGQDAAAQQVDAATQALTDAQKPELPLEVIKRRGSGAGAFVVEFHNTSAEPLALRVLFSRQSTKASRRFDMLIGPNAVEPVGDFQEWAFAAGDSISIHKDGFKPVETTVGN
jgi:hypothetical protein